MYACILISKISLFHHNLGWPYVRVIPDMSSFSGFKILSGIFLIVRKCPGLWPLPIACGKQGCPKSLSPRWMLLRGEMSSPKVTSFFTASGSKSNYTVLAAEGAFAFHNVKHHSTMKCSWADMRVKMWRFSSLSETDPVLIFKGEYGDGVRDGDGFSPWNIRKPSRLDAAVCLRTFHWILSP